MINHIQKLHETKHYLEEEIKKQEETLASGIFTTTNEKLEARVKILELKRKLHSAERSLRDLL